MPKKTMTTKNLAQTEDDPETEAPEPVAEKQAEPKPAKATRAAAPVKVRALTAFASFGDGGRTVGKGDVFELSPEAAAGLVRGGLAEYVK